MRAKAVVNFCFNYAYLIATSRDKNLTDFVSIKDVQEEGSALLGHKL
jgi:hypothetical protein